jgi:hypothetical protein
VLSATANRLRVSIPSGPSFSGILTVATPGGTNQGPDVFVAPPGYTAAQVGFTARMRNGGATTVDLPQPGRIGLLTIDAAGNQRLSIDPTNSTIASGFLTVLAPGGAGIPQDGATQFISGSTPGFLGPTTLPGRGTYTVVVSPSSGSSGKVTLTPNLFLDQIGAITPNGPAVTADIKKPGQRALFRFEPRAGKRVSVVLTGGTFSQPCGGSLSILSPDGNSLAHAAGCLGADFIPGTAIPRTAAPGTYTVVVAPADTDTGTARVRLYQFSDQAGKITPNGPAVKSDIRFPGQRSLFRFSGISGDTVSVDVTAASFPNPCGGNLYLLSPDGSILSEAAGCLDTGDSISPVVLPKSGTYMVEVDAGAPPDTGTAQVKLTETSGASSHTISTGSIRFRRVGWGGGSHASLAGRVLKLDGTPLAGVTLSVGKKASRSSSAGNFVLEGLTGGHHVLIIDGGTAKPLGSWGTFVDSVDLAAGKTTRLPYTIWMTRLVTRHTVTINSPTRGTTVVSNPAIPGLQLVLAPGTVIRDRLGKIVRRISLTPIPVQKPPFPLPPFIQLPTYFTIQPGDVTLSKGARLFYPNWSKQPPGVSLDFWDFDPNWGGWWVYGHGHVSRNGKQVIPARDVEIHDFNGAMINSGDSPPPDAPPPDCSCSSGDPVDNSTGLFVFHQTLGGRLCVSGGVLRGVGFRWLVSQIGERVAGIAVLRLERWL